MRIYNSDLVWFEKSKSGISFVYLIIKQTFFSIFRNRTFTLNLKRKLRSFSIQLKFPRGQKIPPDFRTEHAQSWHLINRTEKVERKKKLRIFNFLGGFSRKKIINQSNLSKTLNKHSEKWQSTTWKKLFFFPLGLTKTLSWI